MKRENLFLIINTALMIIVGLVFVTLATRVVPNSPEDYLFNKVIELKNEEVIQQTPEEEAFGYVHSKQVAYDNSGNVIGDVYTIIIKNEYGRTGPDDKDGFVELYVGIDKDDQLTVQIDTLIQSSWTIAGIQRYINLFYQQVNINDVEAIAPYDATDADLMSGMTATETTGGIKALVLEVIEYHNEGLPVGPTLLNVNLTPIVELNGTFDPYLGITAYDIQDGDVTDLIEVIGFDTINFAVPGVYAYTVSATDSDDNTTSVTISITIVGSIVQIFDDAFGNGYVATDDSTFTETGDVKSRQTVESSEGVDLGYIYTLTGFAMYYVDYDDGDITLYVALANDGEILGIAMPKALYNHTKGASAYYDLLNAAIQDFVGTNISDIELIISDLDSGATNSQNLVERLLNSLKEVVLG